MYNLNTESIIYSNYVYYRHIILTKHTRRYGQRKSLSVLVFIYSIIIRTTRNPSISKKLLESDVLRSSTIRHSQIEDEVFTPAESNECGMFLVSFGYF